MSSFTNNKAPDKFFFRLALFLACMSFTVPYSQALESDRDQPVQVTADSASYNQKSGVAVYSGNVLVIQGTLHLWADQLTVKTDNQGKVQSSIAIGNPARYQQVQDPNKGPVMAHAQEIDYDLVNDRLTLLHDAHIKQDSSSADGSIIHYSIQEQHIDAEGGEQGRVFLIFPAQQDKKTPDSLPAKAPVTPVTPVAPVTPVKPAAGVTAP